MFACFLGSTFAFNNFSKITFLIKEEEDWWTGKVFEFVHFVRRSFERLQFSLLKDSVQIFWKGILNCQECPASGMKEVSEKMVVSYVMTVRGMEN